jgi:site-specific DNA-methyltransferase (adenine-specific)
MQTNQITQLSVPSNSILHGDCISLMRNLPDNSIDFILTDPP